MLVLAKVLDNALSTTKTIFIDNHKAYVQSWIQKIRDKTETLIKAIKDAQPAANYMDYKAGIISKDVYDKLRGAVKEIRTKEHEFSG